MDRNVTINGVTKRESQWASDAVVASAARAGFKIGGVDYTYNSRGKLVRNDGGPASADAPGKRGSVQAGGEEDDDETTDTTFPSRRGKGLEGDGVKFNREQQEAMDQVIAQNRRNREQLIGHIVANVHDAARKDRMVQNLSRKTTEELRDLADAVVPVGNSLGVFSGGGDVEADLNFAGAAGGDAQAVTNAESDEGVLDLPTMNYADLATQNAQERVAREQFKQRVG